MTLASLGPGPADDILKVLLDGTVLAAMPTTATLALTVGSANPTGPPVELTAAGYAQQPIAWSGAAGQRSNVAAASWSLPNGTIIGGISVLNSLYSTLANPLAWIDLAYPLTAQDGVAFLVPAASIHIRGFTPTI